MIVLLDRPLPEDLRWSVLHHGRPQMLDHILASRTLHGAFRSIEVHNEALGDELVGMARGYARGCPITPLSLQSSRPASEISERARVSAPPPFC